MAAVIPNGDRFLMTKRRYSGEREMWYQVALASSTVEVIDHEEPLDARWPTLDQVRKATASFPRELADAAIRFVREATSRSARLSS